MPSRADGVSLLELKQRLDALTAEQAVLLDKVLEDMDSLELNTQLEAVTAEKQDIMDQMQALEEDKSQRSLRASRQREMEAWLDQQPLCFTGYDDTITHKFIERITVVDAGTIRVKIRDISQFCHNALLVFKYYRPFLSFAKSPVDRVPVREFDWATELVTRYYGTSFPNF